MRAFIFALMLACPVLLSSAEIQKIVLPENYSWDHRYYLATYPRSGNHWMRYLIEEATGIATSSVYQDPDPHHMPYVFPWGGYCCFGGYEGLARYPVIGESVIVKTHFPALPATNYDRLPTRKVIRIVRHPLDSIYSFYVYVKGNELEEIVPQNFFIWAVEAWLRFQSHWDQENNVLTISYEELFHHPKTHLTQVLSTAGYSFTEQDVLRALEKYPPQGGVFKHFHHYTQEQIDYVFTKLGPLMQKHGY